MISSKNSLLYAGILKWIYPRELVKAISGCLRIVSEPCCGTAHMDTSLYNPVARGKSFCTSIPLSSVEKDDIAGHWVVRGLPRDIVMIGKSPDNSECLMVGKEFKQSDDAYIFRVNPITAGVLNRRESFDSLSFWCLGGTPEVRDFPQYRGSRYGISGWRENEVVIGSKSKYCAVNGSSGFLNGLASGRLCSNYSGTVERHWTEGDVQVALIKDNLIYADKHDNFCLDVESGEMLKTEADVPGTVYVLDHVCGNTGLQRFVKDHRPDTLENRLVQRIKLSVQGDTYASTAFIIYETCGMSKLRSVRPEFSSVPDVRIKAVRDGGYIECAMKSEDGDKPVIINSDSGKVHGRQAEPGDVLAAVVLVDGGTITKVIYPEKTCFLFAQATWEIELSGKVKVINPEKATVDMTEYWLEVEQDVPLATLNTEAMTEVV